MRWMWIAALSITLAMPAGAQARKDEPEPLPEAVAIAWGLYLEASRAGDINAAGDAARETFRAAQASNVDPVSRAIIADTAGQFAFIRGQFAEARAMFEVAAPLFESLGPDHTSDHVRVLALLADACHRNEQFRDALRYVSAALDAAGPPGVDPQRDADIALAFAVRARIHWRQGSVGQTGQAARDALHVLEPYGYHNNTSAPLMAFYAGVERAMRQRMMESAWWFGVAHHLFDAQGQDSQFLQITDVWSRYARQRITSGQRRELIQRLDAAGYLSAPERAEAEAETDLAEAEERAEPDPLNRPARPVRRDPPSYPSAAAWNQVEGIALVTFTVNAQGRVEDPEVVFSAPHPMFGDEALRAIRRWRYEPRLVDGVPTAHEGVQTTLDFRMED